MTQRIYLRRPPVEAILDWAFEKLSDVRTLVIWDGDRYDTFVVPERDGTTMNFTLDYLWDMLKSDQVLVEQAFRGRESELEYVE